MPQSKSHRWLAPEIALALVMPNPPLQPFNFEADVYSFGVVLVEMITLRLPFHKLTDSQVGSQNLALPGALLGLWAARLGGGCRRCIRRDARC